MSHSAFRRNPMPAPYRDRAPYLPAITLLKAADAGLEETLLSPLDGRLLSRLRRVVRPNATCKFELK
jgi:hypothetical protein